MGPLRSLPRLTAFMFSVLITLSSFAIADDAAVMSKLLAALKPAPSRWSATTSCCNWKNVKCDSSNRVTSINLASKSISGTLPSDLGSLTQLTSLSLQHNSFSGPLPSLANLSFLQEVYLHKNDFTSIPPDFFQGLTSLHTFSLDDNSNLPTWTIPTELTQATSLVTFYASNASVYGSLPDIFASFPSLRDLRLSYNNITGPLPKSFGGSRIQNLWLNNQQNGMSGTIDVLSSMTQLSQVWLQKNQFTGPIPDLSKCTSLFDLQLRDNQFTGVIPASLMSISSLKNISLSNNELQGPLPEFPKTVTSTIDSTNSFCKNTPGLCDSQVTTLLEVAAALRYPIKLAIAWQGNNACDGWSFITCDSQGKITVVNFAKQCFSGTISPAFGNLTSLRTLALANNDLTGSIPDNLATLPDLQVLDVSNNNLNGSIPKFASTVKFTRTGNPLLGTTTPSSGSGAGTPSTDSNSTTPSGSPAGTAPGGTPVSPGIIVITVVIFVVAVLFVSIKCYLGKQHRKFGRVENHENGVEVVRNGIMGGVKGNGGVPSELHSQSSGDRSVRHFSIEDLRQATNNFSKENILGRGGCGVVYKGELHDRTKIAVKKMKSRARGNKEMNGFQAEIAVLTKVTHRHLVALFGCCVNGKERLLVYEYMPQGTLTQHLFDWHKNGWSPLTWKQRVTIALDVARGVEYLHGLAQQRFIHRDLKPSNILLGDDMRAKVADFGLVRKVPDGKHSVETQWKGTFGYFAPEIAATGRVTAKVDVYAFGVVLMQLITGRRAVEVDDTSPDKSSHLVTWFRSSVLMDPINMENIRKAIDQTLKPNEETPNEETMNSIYEVARLAGHCTADDPDQRPDMGRAVHILTPLVEKWKPLKKRMRAMA